MADSTSLVATIVVGLCLAFMLGIIATRMRISPLMGYLLAGIMVGPYTGGFHANAELIDQLAQIGIILLMFGVGLHFSLSDLLSVKKIAIPGSLVHISISTSLGTLLGHFLGWPLPTALIFGLSLATASTVVILRTLQEQHLLESDRGRIAIGWLIAEDIAMILVLVLVPALSKSLGGAEPLIADPFVAKFNLGLLGIVLLTFLKVSIFVGVMLVFGRRVIPWILQQTVQSGSRELFRLGVLAIALGVAAGAAELFGVSLSLGAFFAGMIMSESDLSQRAAEESLPLRDAFAVLFFISVGMLFNPATIWRSFFPLIGTLFIILIASPVAAFFVVKAFKKNVSTALTLAASIAQIGEFSFMLASLGSSLHLLNAQARDLIMGSAILSILLNPLVFLTAETLKKLLEERIEEKSDGHPASVCDTDLIPSTLQNHIIIIGSNAIALRIARHLQRIGYPVLLVDDSPRAFVDIPDKTIETLYGNAAKEEVLEATNLANAKLLVLTVENTFEVGQIALMARKIKPDINILAHTKDAVESQYLLERGINKVMANDKEVAKAMISFITDTTALPLPKQPARALVPLRNSSS